VKKLLTSAFLNNATFERISTKIKIYLRVCLSSLPSLSDLCPLLGPVLEGSGQQVVVIILVTALVLVLALVKSAVDPQSHMYHSRTLTRRTQQFFFPMHPLPDGVCCCCYCVHGHSAGVEIY